MFYYFGRKGRLASSYPEPLYPVVIEPFAGSMAYSLFHRPNVAIGLEADRRVVNLWQRLVGMSLAETRAMKVPAIGERTSDLYWMLAASSNMVLGTSRYRTMTPFMHDRAQDMHRMTIRHHTYASTHVHYRWADYTDAPDIEATWFVDPPYQNIEGGYAQDHSTVDYEALAEWCLARKGQVIVCENAAGTWLPFKYHKRFRGTRVHRGIDYWASEHTWASAIRVCKGPRCTARFRPARASHVYCSSRCRVAAHRLS